MLQLEIYLISKKCVTYTIVITTLTLFLEYIKGANGN